MPSRPPNHADGSGESGVKQWVEAKFVVETDMDKLCQKMIDCIEEKRAALGI